MRKGLLRMGVEVVKLAGVYHWVFPRKAIDDWVESSMLRFEDGRARVKRKEKYSAERKRGEVWLSSYMVKAMLDISDTTLRRWLRTGVITAYKPAGRLMFKEKEIKERLK